MHTESRRFVPRISDQYAKIRTGGDEVRGELCF